MTRHHASFFLFRSPSPPELSKEGAFFLMMVVKYTKEQSVRHTPARTLKNNQKAAQGHHAPARTGARAPYHEEEQAAAVNTRKPSNIGKNPSQRTLHRATPRRPAGSPVLAGTCQFGTAWAGLRLNSFIQEPQPADERWRCPAPIALESSPVATKLRSAGGMSI